MQHYLVLRRRNFYAEKHHSNKVLPFDASGSGSGDYASPCSLISLLLLLLLLLMLMMMMMMIMMMWLFQLGPRLLSVPAADLTVRHH